MPIKLFMEKIWITEWNSKPSEKLNNTIANGAWQFNQMVSLRNRVEYFWCIMV